MADTITCPAWCVRGDDEYPCRGEHWEQKTYLSATGGTPHEVTCEGGAQYPVVGVGLDFSEMDGDDAPSIGLHLTGPRCDADVRFKASEVEGLIAALQARLTTVRNQTVV